MKRLLAGLLIVASLALQVLEATHSHAGTQVQPCAVCAVADHAVAAPATGAPVALPDSGWTLLRPAVASVGRSAVSLLPSSRGPPAV